VNWEETIKFIRTKPEYNNLVLQAYIHEDLELNIKNFGSSQEFLETLKIFNKYAPGAQSILDIGSGNGISSINFALNNYTVSSVEPDKSLTVGNGAIKILKEKYALDKLTVYESFAEDIKFNDNEFDIVYARQSMHHANDLKSFVSECLRVLRPGGLLLTVRDHVVLDQEDKERFFQYHALHKYYGGENAFTLKQYSDAFTGANGKIIRTLAHYDSVINFYPDTLDAIEIRRQKWTEQKKRQGLRKLGFLARIPGVPLVYNLLSSVDSSEAIDESHIPGRMYTFIVTK
jgi:ubiquinone/menaquinone biosynthesis C-methylase UbiE